MARATVIIDERKIPFTLNDVEFELVPESDKNTGRYTFQTMVVDKIVKAPVFGSKIEQNTSTASGKVVFFNEYSSKTQTIKKGTTLIGDNKKNYKTTEEVEIPGYTLKNKVKEPGTSPSVKIVAVETGPSYNTEGTTFKISGFSGSHSKGVYAQSAGAITGGDDVMIHSVSDKDASGVAITLQARLIESLKRESNALIPPDYVTYPNFQIVSIDDDSLQLKGNNIKFQAEMHGYMTTYLFSRKMLESMIANHVRGSDKYVNVSIPTIENLEIIPIDGLPVDPKKVPEVLRVRINGEGSVITKVPVSSVRQLLAGTPKKKFGEIVAEFPEIESAEYNFIPFWSPFFPTNLNHIKINTR